MYIYLMRLILVIWFILIATGLNAQKTQLQNPEFCYCEIPDKIIITEIEKFWIRNPDTNRLIVLKLPTVIHDTTLYKVVITQILFKESLKENPPKAYTTVKGRVVLIYGLVNFNCVRKNYKEFSSAILKKHLIESVIQKKHKDGSTSSIIHTFDPEILEVGVDKGKIVSKTLLR